MTKGPVQTEEELKGMEVTVWTLVKAPGISDVGSGGSGVIVTNCNGRLTFGYH